MQQCLFCGRMVTMIFVHGHYQCPSCYTNALPCCDGDNCETNYFLREKNNKKSENTEAESQNGEQNS